MLVRAVLVSVFFALLSLCSLAQRAVFGSDGEIEGYVFSVNSAAPYCIVLPQQGVDMAGRYELAVRLNKLGVNAFIIPDAGCYVSLGLDFEEACVDLRRRVDALGGVRGAPVVIMGATRSASIALVAATRDLRIKAVLAISPGEYLGGGRKVEKLLETLRVPTQVVCTKAELPVAKQLLRGTPKSLLFFSSSLRTGGYGDLLTSGLASGESWLAISIFLNEQFQLRFRGARR